LATFVIAFHGGLTGCTGVLAIACVPILVSKSTFVLGFLILLRIAYGTSGLFLLGDDAGRNHLFIS
jgi:hypothetical protein